MSYLSNISLFLSFLLVITSFMSLSFLARLHILAITLIDVLCVSIKYLIISCLLITFLLTYKMSLETGNLNLCCVFNNSALFSLTLLFTSPSMKYEITCFYHCIHTSESSPFLLLLCILPFFSFLHRINIFIMNESIIIFIQLPFLIICYMFMYSSWKWFYNGIDLLVILYICACVSVSM